MDNLCSVTEGPAVHIATPSLTKECNPKDGTGHNVQNGEVHATFDTIPASSGKHLTDIFDRQKNGGLKHTHSILHKMSWEKTLTESLNPGTKTKKASSVSPGVRPAFFGDAGASPPVHGVLLIHQ